MLKNSLWLILFLCLIQISVANETEFWATSEEGLDLGSGYTFNMIEEIHTKGEINVYEQYVGVRKAINENFEVGGWYKLVSVKKNDEYREKQRFVFGCKLSDKIGDFSVSNRFWFERSMSEDFWKYRNKTSLSTKIKFMNRTFTPFVTEEWFLGLCPNFELCENRSCLGIGTKFIGNSQLSTYYMIKKDLVGQERIDVIGIGLSFNF
jgi:hypothetical protein